MSLLPTLLGTTSGGGGGGSGSVPGIILTPVVAASTVALTVTYANGSSGVGATLTNAGAQAAISLDGVSPTVGQRVLIKNQASALQNGVYTVTTVGSGATNWVLTRATDFDQASDMTAGAQVDVAGGSTQSASIWILTASVATVGTNNVTFTQSQAAAPTVTGRFLGMQTFKASGTYTPTSGATTALVEAWGGAGGGGTTNSAQIGSGGGGGAYVRGTVAASSQTVTIGAAGAGGGANNGTAPTAGTATSLGTLVVAAGGSAAANGGGAAGAGGTVAASTVPSNGLGIAGSVGQSSVSSIATFGGSSFGNLANHSNVVGASGLANTAAGGGGGNSATDGGAGGTGLMVIYEFS